MISFRNLAILLIVLMVLALSVTAGFFLIGRKKYDFTDKKAALLIQKIKEYKKDKGAYPRDLNELVPIYLERIPMTGFGKDFIYYDSVIYHPFKKAIKNEYTLRYYGRFGVEATYLSHRNEWYYDD